MENKQIKTLISWAKKYMDCDAVLETTIESFHVRIKTEMVFEQMHMLISINKSNVPYYYSFNFNTNKWTKVNN